MFDDAAAFMRSAASYLDSIPTPFSASVIAVYAGQVRAGRELKGLNDLWAAVSEGRRVVGVAMHTPPYRLLVVRMPDGRPPRWPTRSPTGADPSLG